MRLLVVTQVVDKHDPVLGFFHQWIEELSEHFESIEVICLQEGEHALPKNVRVRSLGKERHKTSSFMYTIRFMRYVHTLSGSYDAVFVHMNPEYVVLAGWYWKLRKRRSFLWYNHPKGGMRLFFAQVFASKIFFTSPYAASARFNKAVRMPAGIDTNLFKPTGVAKKPFSLYLQGRVTRSKRIDMALETLQLLREAGTKATLTIVGPEEEVYVRKLKEKYKDLIMAGTVSFLGPKPHHETPVLYSAHAVALNLAASGHYDKTVLEALACEIPAVVSGRGFDGIIPDWLMGHDTSISLAQALQKIFSISSEEYLALGKNSRTVVEKKESLEVLVQALSDTLKASYPLK